MICIDWFDPAFRAGGPIRSVANLVQALFGTLDIYILTSDSDRGTTEPLNIITDTWLSYKGIAQVKYLTKSNRNRKAIRQALEEVQPHCVYCNSMFSEIFTRIPLQEAGYMPGVRRVLAVRGMLKPEALAQKRWKKLPYLYLFRLSGLHQGIIFHATSVEEASEIKAQFGTSAAVKVLQNLPSTSGEMTTLPEKHPGTLRLISISRILPHKNILQMIRILGTSGLSVQFSIYGPVEDVAYWKQCQEAIAALPENVAVTYFGTITPEQVVPVLGQHHALFSLSESENFGHTIIESLQAGRPVVIGNRTPWKGLESAKAGFDLSLNQSEAIIEALRKLSAMDSVEFQCWSLGAQAYAQEHLMSPDTLGYYLGLFSGNSENRA